MACEFRICYRMVIKFTPSTEAANMEFTNIPVPRIHDVFVIDSQTYIVMDYVDVNAPELTNIWGKLTPRQQEGIFT